MILRSPAEFYIKYLVTHPSKYNNSAVKKKIRRSRLLYISDDYIDEIRQELEVPKPFFPGRRGHKPSKDFLIEEGIYGLWHRNEHTQMALSALNAPKAQEIIETMLAVGAPAHTVAILLDKRLDMPFSEQAVQRYKKYFWNVDLVNTTELRQICHYMALEGAEDEKTDLTMRKAIAASARTSPRILAAELPSTPLSTALVQSRLGYIPADMDMYHALKKNMQLCSMRVFEAAALGGRYASEHARNWAWTMQFLAGLIETITAPEEDLRKMLRGVELVTTPLKTPTIHQLTGGNFSDGTYAQGDKNE